MTKRRPSLCDALLHRAPVLQELAQRASIALIHMIPENLGIGEQQHRSSRHAGVPGTPVVAIAEEAIRLRLDDDLVSAMSMPAVRHADLVLVVPHARHILNATHWLMFTLRRIGALLTDGQGLAYIFPRASGHGLPRRFSIETDTLTGRYLSTVIEFSASALPLDIPDRFRMRMVILDDVPPSSPAILSWAVLLIQPESPAVPWRWAGMRRSASCGSRDRQCPQHRPSRCDTLLVPAGDLCAPGGDGAPEPVDLGGHGGVLEVDGELVHGFDAELVVGDVVDGSEGLFGVPGVSDLAVGFARVEQAPQSGAARVDDVLRRRHEQFARPVQLVVAAAAVAQRLVLDPAAHVVEGVVAQPHDVERVRDLSGFGHSGVERGPVGAREVQHRPADRLAPLSGPSQQPACGRFSVAASGSWPRPMSTTLVPQVLARNHTQPSSATTSLSGRPRQAWRVAHRAALPVNSARAGAISAACSVTLPASQPPRGQRQRRLCHTSRTGRPHAGRFTSNTGRSPSDHNAPPHPPQGGLAPPRRTCTSSGSPS